MVKSMDFILDQEMTERAEAGGGITGFMLKQIPGFEWRTVLEEREQVGSRESVLTV